MPRKLNDSSANLRLAEREEIKRILAIYIGRNIFRVPPLPFDLTAVLEAYHNEPRFVEAVKQLKEINIKVDKRTHSTVTLDILQHFTEYRYTQRELAEHLSTTNTVWFPQDKRPRLYTNIIKDGRELSITEVQQHELCRWMIAQLKMRVVIDTRTRQVHRVIEKLERVSHLRWCMGEHMGLVTGVVSSDRPGSPRVPKNDPFHGMRRADFFAGLSLANAGLIFPEPETQVHMHAVLIR